nr:hypothetical protein [Lachnospiraceae bacterium]
TGTGVKTYNGTCYAVMGVVKKLSGNELGIGTESRAGYIRCEFGGNDKLALNEKIRAQGTFRYSLVDGGLIFHVAKVWKTDEEINENLYCDIEGNSYDKTLLNKRTLNEGNINFYIPPAWESVEHDIVAEDLGIMEGYQYTLNEMPHSASATPESFFVCYFNNDLLKNLSDRTKTKAVEKAIIRNILNKGNSKLEKFPLKDKTTHYGENYRYYQDSYNTLLGEGYHTEFIFTSYDSDGVIVYIYLYKEPVHKNDIFFVMRMLED